MFVQSSSEDFKYGCHIDFMDNFKRTKLKFGGRDEPGIVECQLL